MNFKEFPVNFQAEETYCTFPQTYSKQTSTAMKNKIIKFALFKKLMRS